MPLSKEQHGRYTLSLHKGQNVVTHFDLFLDLPESTELIHYSIGLNEWRKIAEQKDIKADSHKIKPLLKRGKNHRKKYATFSGAVSKNRGRVRVLKQGRFKACIHENNWPDTIKMTCLSNRFDKND